ncbi:ribosomal subunit interface protein [Nocardia sp. SYP-A9097]|uniref:ribosomal subunit interface protein n=1 Tax=Nocardia sp. SYP-A9097 TaxID=2663237 RepID=UPI00129A9B5B|nr:ribosomal subunit interface protein [Nocardia sp. SYP-A9097]MRH88127.1 ribosomal subunit interface protein [Nocardia sp. SYP-A9097]
MHVQVFADKHIGGSAALIEQAQDTIESILDRYADNLTRVEAHITDVNGHKGGLGDKQCNLEARPKGQPPVAVRHRATTVEEAYIGAAESMAHLLDSRFGRLHHTKGSETIRHMAAH